jgi:hypothetical protein
MAVIMDAKKASSVCHYNTVPCGSLGVVTTAISLCTYTKNCEYIKSIMFLGKLDKNGKMQLAMDSWTWFFCLAQSSCIFK